MEDATGSEETLGDSSGEPRAKESRGAVVRFAAIFLLSATVMLAGYDMAEQTTANDWYLLQVANSCRLLLAGVGYSCEVGRLDRFAGREKEVRAALAAWRGGTAPADGADAPLSQWECWRYEAGQRRRSVLQEATSPRLRIEPFGPSVHFVLRAGLHRQLADARKELARLETLPAQVDKATAERERVKRLQNAIAEASRPGHTVPPDTAFSFMVVPDCGAVQILAIYIAAVLAFPAAWFARALGAVVGSFLLFWVNSARLAVLAIAGALDNGGPTYRFMHEYLWQAIYIVFVLAAWLAWVTWTTRREARP